MRKRTFWMMLLCTLCMLCGCGAPQTVPETEAIVREPVQVSSGRDNLADSLDKAVIQEIDEINGRISLYNLELGKRYTLTYDSATGIKGRHDEELVAAQLEVGDVVEVSFLKETKQAKNIWLDKAVSRMEDITEFEINRTALWMNVGDTRYAIAANAAVIGPERLLSLIDINEADTLAAYVDENEHMIYSFLIMNEHGYVRLEGAESFIGGFVEFGQTIIRRVEEDMLLVLPSGSYDMHISYQNYAGDKHVDVLPGEETLVDVSDLVEEEERQEGGIIFTITPSSATLKIDGEETDYSDVVTLSYGIHQMIVSCEGYKTITQYIRVGQEMANINVELEESLFDNDISTDTGNTSNNKEPVSSNSAVSEAGEGYKVYIDAPEGAELYMDGKYIGIIPTVFDKKAGRYVISVRKSGYVTRSYSLEVDDSPKDVHYSFSELEVSK